MAKWYNEGMETGKSWILIDSTSLCMENFLINALVDWKVCNLPDAFFFNIKVQLGFSCHSFAVCSHLRSPWSRNIHIFMNISKAVFEARGVNEGNGNSLNQNNKLISIECLYFLLYEALQCDWCMFDSANLHVSIVLLLLLSLLLLSVYEIVNISL